MAEEAGGSEGRRQTAGQAVTATNRTAAPRIARPRPTERRTGCSKAVVAGYKDAAHMAKDTDLDPLRMRDDFKKLVADLEKKSP